MALPYLQRALAPDAPTVGSSFWPTRAADQSDARLLPEVTAPAGAGGFATQQTNTDGTPVRYDPCRPLHYAINPAGGPAGGTALIRESIGEISAAAGLVFTYDSATGEPAQTDREPVQQGRYGIAGPRP